MVYKLVELDGAGRIKLSPGKRTYPLAKQVYRRRDAEGRFAGDRVTRADETAEGEPLLVPVVRDGQARRPLPDLDAIRARCREQIAALPDSLRGPDAAPVVSGRPTATPSRPRPRGSVDAFDAVGAAT